MSWWVAGVAIAGAGSKFLGSQSKSRDMQEAARDSLLTGRYNINQRKLESRQTQFAILEQGQQAASQIQTAANQAVGSATVAAGGSGATIDSGTPRAVLTNIAQEGLQAQMSAILNTKNAIKSNVRQTEAINKTEWNQANAYAKGLNRDAKRTMDNARMDFAADTISAVAGGYASSLTAASTTGKVIKGAQVAKSVAGAGRGGKGRMPQRHYVGGRGIGMRKAVKYKGYKNIHKKSKYSYGSFKSNRVFYQKGESTQSGKMPGGGSIYKGKGLKSSPYDQRGYKPAWNEEGGFKSNLMNFFRGTGWKGRASQKKFNY